MAQFYAGAEVDDYLRQVRSQAVARKLDVTASAVVRLAIGRLMAHLTSDQVTEAMAQPSQAREALVASVVHTRTTLSQRGRQRALDAKPGRHEAAAHDI